MQNKVVVLSETKTKYGADAVCLLFYSNKASREKTIR